MIRSPKIVLQVKQMNDQMVSEAVVSKHKLKPAKYMIKPKKKYKKKEGRTWM